MDQEPRAEGGTAGEEDTAELLREYERQVLALPVREHVERMLTTLSGLALQRMGLGERDVASYEPQQARLAIDAFRALTDVLVRDEPALAGVYRATLAQMQLAFASLPQRQAAAGDAGAGPAEGASAEAASGAAAGTGGGAE